MKHRALAIIAVAQLLGCGPGLQDGSTKIVNDVYLFSRHVLGDSLLLRISKSESKLLVKEHIIAYQLVEEWLGVSQYPVDLKAPDYNRTLDCSFYLVNATDYKRLGPMTHTQFYDTLDKMGVSINLVPDTGKYGHLCTKISR